MTDDPLRALVRALGEPRRLGRGELLHHAGDALTHATLVVDGWIGRARINAMGEHAFTGVHFAGELPGVEAIVTGRLDDDLFALGPAAVLRAPVDRLRAALEKDASTAMTLARLLAADAGFLRAAILSIGRQASGERLAAFILQTFRRLVAAGLVPPHARSFHLPLTQAQLGAVTGLTAVHVNRVLRQLREARCLDVRSGVVRIDDLPALEAAAQLQP